MKSAIEKFISIVVPLSPEAKPQKIEQFVSEIGRKISSHFLDTEVIFIDFGAPFDVRDLAIDAQLRTDCYVVRLSRATIWDQAALAGIERANGDYVLLLDPSLLEQIEIVENMLEASQHGADIVGLRSRSSPKGKGSLSRRLFFAAMSATGDKRVGPRDRRDFLISRRAANWIVRDGSAFWYMNEAFVATGLATTWLEVDIPLTHIRSRDTASDLAWGAMARSPRFLRLMSLYLIMGLLGLLALAVLNTLVVRVSGFDLFGQPQTFVPGWAYLVIIISAGFSAVTAMLYMLLMVQLVILEHVRGRPRYIVEYFGRV